MRQVAFGSGLLLCLLAAAACGSAAAPAPEVAPAARSSCTSESGFALSLVSDQGGQRSPVAAAVWFSRHGGMPGIPHGGWREVSRVGRGVTVQSGVVTLHVIQGPDRTWQVDSGRRCS